MAKLPSPGRLEAFSDGVIAVIITIMVLEFKVPKEHGVAGLRSILPTLAVYAISFAFTGVYWINHHHIIDRLKRVDALIMWSNLLFLFCLSLLPFATSYLIDDHMDSFSVALYSVGLLVDGLTFTLLTKSIVRHLRHVSEGYETDEAELETREQIAEQRKGFLSVAVYLLGIPAAYWHPRVALAMVASVTVIWIVPTFLVPARHPRQAGEIGAWKE